jgi:hypothetical protein
MQTMEEIQTKLREIIDFLIESREILYSHITEAYILNTFSQIPSSWFADLSVLPYENFLDIFSHTSKVNPT